MKHGVRLLHVVLLMTLVGSLLAPVGSGISAQEPGTPEPSEEFQTAETGVGSLEILGFDQGGNPLNDVCFIVDDGNNGGGNYLCTGYGGVPGQSWVAELAAGEHTIIFLAPPDYLPAVSETQTFEIIAGQTTQLSYTFTHIPPTPENPPDYPLMTLSQAVVVSTTPPWESVREVTVGMEVFFVFQISDFSNGLSGVRVDTDRFGTICEEITIAPMGWYTCEQSYTVTADDLTVGVLTVTTTVTADGFEPIIETLNWPIAEATRPDPEPDPDTTGPNVAFDIIEDGDTFTGTVTLAANVDDPSGVAEVRFKYSTTPDISESWVTIATDTDSLDGWWTELDTTTIPNGPVSLRAVAEDTLGNTATAQISVTIDNPVAAPQIEVTVTASNEVIAAGDTVIFDITVTNTGTGPAHEVAVVDALPFGVDWFINSGDPACSIDVSNTLICSFDTLEAGDGITIRVTGSTTQEHCGTLQNTVTVSASNDPSGERSATASVTVICPDLAIAVVAVEPVINAGDAASFIITVTNVGPGTAHDVIVADVLPPGIWTIDSAVAVCNITDGMLECVLDSLNPEESEPITVSRTTDAGDCGVLDNSATVMAGNEGSGAISNNSATASITVDCAADLMITTTAESTTVNAGDPVSFTITIENAGTGPAYDVTLSEVLPAGLLWSVDSGAAGCVITGETLECVLGTLAPGQMVSVSLTATTSPQDCGTISLGSASVVINCPDVVVTMVADWPTVNAGDQVTFTISVDNFGPGTAYDVNLIDELPIGFVWAESSESCTIASDVLTCYFGAMLPGASFAVTMTAETTGAQCGQIANTVSASASNESASMMVNNESMATIEITCSASIQVNLEQENGAPLTGGCFDLWETVDGVQFGDHVGTMCDDSDGTPDGVTRFTNVTGGSYIVRQSDAPSMYPRMGQQVVTVVDGESAVLTFTAPIGGKVTATFLEGTQPVAEFHVAVFTDNGSGQPGEFVKNGVEGRGSEVADGTITIDNLPVGDYVLTGFHLGAYLSPVPVPFSIEAGLETAFDVPVQLGGSVRFATTDAESGAIVTGSCFWLYASDGSGDRIGDACDISDGTNDGITTLYKLQSSTFDWEQYLAAPNYISGQTGTVDVTLGMETTVPVQNVLAGSIVVTLLDEQGDPLVGGYFSLEDAEGVEVALACDTCDGIPDGVSTFNGIPAGDYIVVQWAAIDGYFPAPDEPATVTTGVATPVTMRAERGKVLKLRNVDSGTTSPVTDGCFSLRTGDASGDIIAERCDRDDTIYSDGISVFDGLAAGTYYWEQTVSPWIYVGGGSGTVTLEAGETETMVDVPIEVGGAVVITLYDDQDPPQLLPGGFFRLERDLGDSTRETVATGCDDCDGSYDGETTINGIPAGQYILVQAGAIDYYVPADDQIVSVNVSQVSRLSLTNALPVGEPPVANQDDVTTAVGQPVTIPVLVNDTDSDTPAEELTVALLPADGPAHGTVALDATNSNAIVYTPNPGFFGVDSFFYEVSDGSNAAAGHVRITVVGDLVLEVTSVDSFDTILRWACFDLFTVLPDGSPDRQLTIACDNNGDGVTTFSGLATGRVLLGGYSAPYGLEPVSDRLVDIGPDAVTALSVTYQLAPGTGALAIQAAGDGESLPGLCWDVRQQPIDAPYPNSFVVCDSDDGVSDGLTTVYALMPSGGGSDETTIHPLAVPGGYFEAEPQTATVMEGEITLVTIEHTAGAALRILTVREDGTPAPGACASLFIDNGDGQQGDFVGFNCDGTLPGDPADGTILMQAVPVGNYIIRINGGGAGNDYLLDREYLFGVTADGAIVTEQGGDTLTVVYQLGGAATIHFIDAQGEPVTRQICYTIFHDVGGVRGTPLDLGYSCPGLVWPPDGETPILDNVTIAALPPGDYLFALVAPLNGYALAGDVPFSITAGQNTPVTVTVGVQASGAAVSLSMTTADSRYEPIASATLGQVIQVVYTFANTGTTELTNIRIESGSGAVITTYPLLPTDWGQLSFYETYLVTEADAARGSITFTGTATTDEADLVSASWTIQIVAEPNTPAEPGVPVEVAGGTGATLTFAGIDEPGFSAVIEVDEAPVEPPTTWFSIDDVRYFEISTTATFTGEVLVCIPYEPGTIPDARLLHFENGEWVNITSVEDSRDGLVCGLTDSFSPFAIVQALDTIAPEMTSMPSAVTIEATSPAGATGTFAQPEAEDAESGIESVTCNWSSGDTFPIGTTTVTCTARDVAGNEATGTFTITVQTSRAPTNKNQCKNGGWQTFNHPFFVDQGSCVAYLEKKKR